MDNGGIWKVDGGIEMEGNGNANGSGKWKWKINEMKGLAKMEKLIKDQNGKMENNGNVTKLKDEKSI